MNSLLYEGKAKKIFTTNITNEIIIQFKDSATAFNGKKKDEIKYKGIINNAISSIIFQQLEKFNIETHYIKNINDREILAKRIEIIKIEVVVRNIIAGSLINRTGLKKGEVIKNPIIEFYYKNDVLNDPLINEDHIFLLNLATFEEIIQIKKLSYKINQKLLNIFKSINLTLVDFKLEFGRFNNRIVLGDEISPDTCRLWDSDTNQIFDKDLFRQDLGNLIKSYKEILERLKNYYSI